VILLVVTWDVYEWMEIGPVEKGESRNV
jgi:hypothetical protein